MGYRSQAKTDTPLQAPLGAVIINRSGIMDYVLKIALKPGEIFIGHQECGNPLELEEIYRILNVKCIDMVHLHLAGMAVDMIVDDTGAMYENSVINPVASMLAGGAIYGSVLFAKVIHVKDEYGIDELDNGGFTLEEVKRLGRFIIEFVDEKRRAANESA